MKIKVKDTARSQFDPIEITLVVESEDELIYLWKRFNLSVAMVDDNNRSYKKYESKDFYTVWEKINKLVISRNLEKYKK